MQPFYIYQFVVKKLKIAILIIILYVSVFTFVLLPSSSAHIADSTLIQEKKNVKNNVDIKFSYLPEKPIIDTFTKLEFSVTNLKTGEHFHDFIARVTVTNGQRLFKFQNITVRNGDFSVDYIFPDDGTHQVLLRIDTKEFIQPASFQVFVPHQSPPSILNPFPTSPGSSSENDLGVLVSKILAILLPAAGVTALVIMLKKKPKIP
jgi:hypothetical protein